VTHPVTQADRGIAEAVARKTDYQGRSDWIAGAFAAHRIAALEQAARLAERNARWHEESFRKEVILNHADKQTHFAARHRESEEIARAIRGLQE